MRRPRPGAVSDSGGESGVGGAGTEALSADSSALVLQAGQFVAAGEGVSGDWGSRVLWSTCPGAAAIRGPLACGRLGTVASFSAGTGLTAAAVAGGLVDAPASL